MFVWLSWGGGVRQEALEKAGNSFNLRLLRVCSVDGGQALVETEDNVRITQIQIFSLHSIALSQQTEQAATMVETGLHVVAGARVC